MTVITYGTTMESRSIVSAIIQVPLHSRKRPGLFAVIDEEFADIILPIRWNVVVSGKGRMYAVKNTTVNGKTVATRMHHLILPPDPGMIIDHIDGDSLNNRRSNLRQCTHSQNSRNRRISKTNTSGFTGVTFSKQPNLANPWRATIFKDGRHISLGFFPTAIEAALAYDDAARAFRGEFATLNFPRENEVGVQR